MEHKKFMDIQRIKNGLTDGFHVGDSIIIQEKIDGANAAIRYDAENDVLVAQSRKNILNISNNLRGFYEYVQRLDKEKFKKVVPPNFVVFGEWLVHHSVKYPIDRYNQFYIYDVYDLNTNSYAPQWVVKDIAERLGLNYVPVFYEGDFVSWEHCYQFVGKTELGGEYAEGIIVKNQTTINNPDTRNPFYLKIVSEKFAEVHSSSKKPVDAETLKSREEAQAIAETIVTEARVIKILHKLVDDGVLPDNWGAESMPIVAKNLTKAVFEDCLKEEPETVAKVENFGKVANGIAMRIARSMI